MNNAKSNAILKRYITKIWGYGDSTQVNWPWIMRQVKTMKEEYNLDSKGLYLVLHYAVDYDNYIVDPSYGLGQFIKFIEPAKRFAEQIERSKKLAEDMPEEKIVYVKPHKQTIWIKDEDWDDDLDYVPSQNNGKNRPGKIDWYARLTGHSQNSQNTSEDEPSAKPLSTSIGQ